MSTSLKRYVSVIYLLITVVQKTSAQVGIVYSPFVGQNDGPGSDTYTRDDIKVMLRIVHEKGYRDVTTYGVGSKTNLNPASVVHTAEAAAEINKENQKLSLIIYQGLFLAPPLEQINAEIDLGMKTAKSANEIFSGTVKGIVFPAISSLNELFSHLSEMKMVSKSARDLGMKYGTRITDCSVIDKTNENFKKMIKLLDFVICQILPRESDIKTGFEIFFKLVEKKFLKAENETSSVSLQSRSTPIEFILETGWPGVENMDQQKSVLNMILFWDRIEKWSKEYGKHVFMHEAFDNPWKEQNGNSGQYFGRWKHKETTDNSKNAYELKVGVPPSVPRTGPSNELIFGVVFGLLLFITLIATMIVLYRRVYRLKFTKLTKEELRQFLDGIVTNEVFNEESDQDNPWTRMAYNRDFELAKNKFSIDKTALLGSGAFGSVFKGRIDGLVNDVAFKTTRPDCPLSALRGLLSEIKILIYLGKHENIVSICGAYTAELSNGIVYVATELCSNGSLEKYLRSKKSGYISLNEARYVTAPASTDGQITDLQLLRWTLEIASAMEYISSKNIIHADLATRNVLLTTQFTVKVTDFGLSRRLYEYTEYVKKQQEPLPWRWMAVESLKQLQFSIKSDVWSFGITMWEIFSLGDIPYPGLNWDVNFVTELENGLRMQRPSLAPHSLYEIMASCWNLDPTHRPSFPALKDAVLSMSLQLQKEQNQNDS